MIVAINHTKFSVSSTFCLRLVFLKFLNISLYPCTVHPMGIREGGERGGESPMLKYREKFRDGKWYLSETKDWRNLKFIAVFKSISVAAKEVHEVMHRGIPKWKRSVIVTWKTMATTKQQTWIFVILETSVIMNKPIQFLKKTWTVF